EIGGHVQGADVVKHHLELGQGHATVRRVPEAIYLQAAIDFIVVEILERIDELVLVLLVVERVEVKGEALDAGLALDGAVGVEGGSTGEILNQEQVVVAQISLGGADVEAVVAEDGAVGIGVHVFRQKKAGDLEVVDLNGRGIHARKSVE